MSRSIASARPPALRVLASLALAGSLAVAASADTVRLSTGEVLEVELVELREDGLIVRHPVLGVLRFTGDQATLISSDEPDVEVQGTPEDAAGEGDQTVGEAVQEAEAAVAEALPAARPSLWKHKFVLAASLTSGNTENAAVNAQWKSVRDTERMVTTLDLGYFYSEDDSVRSENRFQAVLNNDWLIPNSKWLVFGRVQYDHDSFQSWDDRVQIQGGVGYKLVEKDDYFLTLRAGLGAIREWGSMNDDWRPEALFGWNGAWQITDKQELTFDSTIFPDLDDTGEFRATSNAEWSALMDEATNLSLVAGLEWEYQSVIDPGQDRNDLRTYLGVQFEF